MKFRSVFLGLALISMLAAAGSAFAGAGDSSGVYLGLKAGYQWFSAGGGLTDTNADANATGGDFDDKDGWAAGAALGYDWSSLGLNLRTELEYMYYDGPKYNAGNGTAGNKDSMSADIDVQTLMLNVFYDFDTGTAWTPYIGAGAGVSFINADLSFDAADWRNGVVNAGDGNADAIDFTWMVALGLAYEIDANWALDLSGRYNAFGDTDTYSNDADDVRFKAKDLETFETQMGLRYTF